MIPHGPAQDRFTAHCTKSKKANNRSLPLSARPTRSDAHRTFPAKPNTLPYGRGDGPFHRIHSRHRENLRTHSSWADIVRSKPVVLPPKKSKSHGPFGPCITSNVSKKYCKSIKPPIDHSRSLSNPFRYAKNI